VAKNLGYGGSKCVIRVNSLLAYLYSSLASYEEGLEAHFIWKHKQIN
jgi:hypothetical protein